MPVEIHISSQYRYHLHQMPYLSCWYWTSFIHCAIVMIQNNLKKIDISIGTTNFYLLFDWLPALIKTINLDRLRRLWVRHEPQQLWLCILLGFVSHPQPRELEINKRPILGSIFVRIQGVVTGA